MEVMKKLCFGAFAKTLKLCSPPDLPNDDLVQAIVQTIDPNSRYKEKNADHSSSVSRLMNCKGNFPSKRAKEDSAYKKAGNNLTDIAKLCKSTEKERVIQNFTDQVIPCLAHDKREQAILILLDIIQHDIDIDNKKLSFEKYFGASKDDFFTQEQYVLSDILASILIYVVNEVNNRCDKKYIEWIDQQQHIEEIICRYKDDFYWDSVSQMLIRAKKESTSFDNTKDESIAKNETISEQMLKIFEQALVHFDIVELINCDPTVMLEEKFIDNIDGFIGTIDRNLLNRFPFGGQEAVYKKIKAFRDIFDEYATYLGTEMKHIDHRNYFVPKFREENPKWAFGFRKETINYRQQIVAIFGEISDEKLNLQSKL